MRDDRGQIQAVRHEVEVVLHGMFGDAAHLFDAEAVRADDVQFLEVKGCPLEALGRLDTGDDQSAAGGEEPQRGLHGLGRADRVVDDGRAVLQPVAFAPRLERRGADPARDLRDKLVGRGGQHGVSAKAGRKGGSGAGPRRRPHLRGRVEVTDQRDHRERQGARTVDEDGLALGGRCEQDGAQRDANGVGQHGRLVRDVIGDREQLRNVRRESFGVGPDGRRAIPDVDRDRQVARAEVAAPGVAAGPARLTRRIYAAGGTRQPRVEHHAFARVRAPSDHLVAEHVRKGHERGEGIVPGAVQQDLLYVGAAQAREGRLHAHPVIRRKRQLIDVLDADGREAGDEGALVDASADGRGRLAGQVVPEYQRLHVGPPSRRDQTWNTRGLQMSVPGSSAKRRRSSSAAPTSSREAMPSDTIASAVASSVDQASVFPSPLAHADWTTATCGSAIPTARK